MAAKFSIAVLACLFVIAGILPRPASRTCFVTAALARPACGCSPGP